MNTDPDLEFWWPKIEKNLLLKKNPNFLDLSLSSTKDYSAREEAFSHQNRTSSTSKHEILNFFLLLWVIFVFLDPDPDPLTLLNPDPDSKHCWQEHSICLFIFITQFSVEAERNRELEAVTNLVWCPGLWCRSAGLVRRRGVSLTARHGCLLHLHHTPPTCEPVSLWSGRTINFFDSDNSCRNPLGHC